MAGEDVIGRVTLGEQIEEVKREVRIRQKVYARLVDEKKMTAAEAEQRTTVDGRCATDAGESAVTRGLALVIRSAIFLASPKRAE